VAHPEHNVIDLGGARARTLLHVDSSVRSTTSVSRQLGALFVAAWREANPGGTVVHRDLAALPVPHQDEDGWMAGLLPPAAHSDAQAVSWSISLPLIEELEAADEYLFSVPMYNLSIPSSFKAWIDRVIVTGRTLMLDGSPAPLGGRKATVLSARGGGYTGTDRASLDHQEPYLRSILMMLGIHDVEVIKAEFTLAGVDPNLAGLEGLRDQSLETAGAQARARALGHLVAAAL
jgi:FMN-dependent NADH-azoreductase